MASSLKKIIIACFRFLGLLVNITKVPLITVLIRSDTPVMFYSFTECYT